MNDIDLLLRAMARLMVRSEILEQEVAALRQEIEKSKGLRPVDNPPENVKTDA